MTDGTLLTLGSEGVPAHSPYANWFKANMIKTLNILGWTTAEAAEYLGTTNRTIRQALNYERNVSRYFLELMSEKFGWSIEYLVGANLTAEERAKADYRAIVEADNPMSEKEGKRKCEVKRVLATEQQSQNVCAHFRKWYVEEAEESLYILAGDSGLAHPCIISYVRGFDGQLDMRTIDKLAAIMGKKPEEIMNTDLQFPYFDGSMLTVEQTETFMQNAKIVVTADWVTGDTVRALANKYGLSKSFISRCLGYNGQGSNVKVRTACKFAKMAKEDFLKMIGEKK